MVGFSSRFDVDETEMQIEIKLDDAGDLQIWLKQGGYEGEALLLPTATTLTLDFPALDRNVTRFGTLTNEDESGNSRSRS